MLVRHAVWTSSRRVWNAGFSLAGILLLAVRAVAMPLSEDARLRQPVSARLSDAPLASCLADLGRQTGVALRASPGYEDRAVTLRVTEAPLGELMDGIASLYGDRWRVQKRSGVPEYLLDPYFAVRVSIDP
jgi:hypothetical protein